MSRVSIIILNYNGKNFLNNCIRSVYGSTYKNFEILVVDNGSSDGSVELAKEEFSHQRGFQVIENKHNCGYALGNNMAVSHSSAETKFLVFLNPDVIVDANWLEPLVEALEDNTIAVAQPKIKMMNDKTRIDSLGHFIDLLTFTTQVGYGELDKGQYNKPFKIFSANGSAIIVRKDVFQSLGGFDPDFFMYFEESDFCWRVWLFGYQVLCVPKAVVYHYNGGLTKSEAAIKRRLYYTFRNKYYSMIKNLEFRKLLVYLPASLILRFCIFIFTSNRYEYIISYTKAVISLLPNMRLLISKRNDFKKQVGNVELEEQGVVKSFTVYYLLRKKAF